MAPMRHQAAVSIAATAWWLQLGPLCVVEGVVEDALLDDECSSADGADCALSALQRRIRQASAPAQEEVDEVDGTPLGQVFVADLPAGWNATDGNVEAQALARDGELHANSGTDCAMNPFARECLLYLSCFGRPYCVLGGYMVVPGKPVPGMESINSGNAKSFDYLMSVAHSMCSGTGCVLITNPVHHRTQDQLHIHFRQYNPKGASVKKRLESAVCAKGGWVPFDVGSDGCASGKARVFNFFPGVFSQVAAAYGGGNLANVGISVWSTTECGVGVKTIVLTTTHCSIEHTISER
mmetsp:Transcript_15016/g.41147  ORF Transcript_15016/g.41147 Transcript_15016/m.41147 type:complete len:295 (-) Transcript_15016:121-1005(-)